MRHYPPRQRTGTHNGWSTNRDSASHMRWARAVKARDGHACIHCGNTQNLRACHITPKKEGGSDTLDNGVTRCKQCDRATDPDAR